MMNWSARRQIRWSALPGWMLGMAVVVASMIAPPSMVWADGPEGCDEESQNTISDRDLTATSMATTRLRRAAPMSADRPCSYAQHDSPSYNRCFIASPRPMSTMPEWITRRQARDAVTVVLEEVYERHEYRASNRDSAPEPLWKMAPPRWLGDVIDELGRAQLPAERGPICIDGVDEENCDANPPLALLVSAGSLAPLHQSSRELEIPWRPGGDLHRQRPLVDLRVGPSPGHQRLPERPPPG